MRRFALLAALALAGAAPAVAGEMLYVSSAQADRIDGYCLGPNGGIATVPSVFQPTVENPRRLLVRDGVLYVAGKNRVESFTIGPNGGLESSGKTKQIDNANPLDLAVDLRRTHVYVPHRGASRIQAYPLDSATGAITGEDATSCIQASTLVALQDLEVALTASGELLYVTESRSDFATGKKGRIDIFPIALDGELPDAADTSRCDSRLTTTTTTSTSSTTVTTTATTSTTTSTLNPNQTPPLSSRTKLHGPGPLALDVPMLFAFDVLTGRIGQWQLNDAGLFDSEDQHRFGKTDQGSLAYDLVLAQGTEGSTILAPAFNQGRIRAYPLKSDKDDLIAVEPKRTTNQRVESTPVRILVADVGGNLVLYVPGGESDDVQGYRLKQRKKGLFPEKKPFSKTDKRKGTYPNDVAIARNVDCQ